MMDAINLCEAVGDAACENKAVEIESLQKEIEDLRWRLRKYVANTTWWREEFRRLERQLQRESSAWKNCKVTSPLTKLEQWCSGISSSGWLWHTWEVSCPCCKRPLDVTVLRDDTEATETPTEGSRLECVKLPPKSDRVPVFESAHVYSRVRYVSVGEIVTATGPPERVDGYDMLPIHPEGAVDVRLFNLLPRSSAPTAVPASPAHEEGAAWAPLLVPGGGGAGGGQRAPLAMWGVGSGSNVMRGARVPHRSSPSGRGGWRRREAGGADSRLARQAVGGRIRAHPATARRALARALPERVSLWTALGGVSGVKKAQSSPWPPLSFFLSVGGLREAPTRSGELSGSTSSTSSPLCVCVCRGRQSLWQSCGSLVGASGRSS